ncbi:translation initiation factor IF-2 N-terminal domain-containing protein [Nocardia sp. CDC159]|uniref:Ribonuclease E n=1 Tax=Nocardia pulmonis TaxID=2951408 RepID=A0A9X2J0A6_9NOCA|nr:MULTISPECIES: translation initiation factor IF-2 N-terminal domain-containing protein [Nocardia]MCM6777624.1 translation initiation factor IF-2 N-terminal domain-containing protein [Nocardia pulmonis]MCM6790572.1 translation initiation factor IF-2 N-terminal domain-containing protein [Nocardia sp. CDC159]
MPERIRVHALAKLLGTTSKRILAHLTELGAEARSPQSSLDRTVAESVRDALVPPEEDRAETTQTTETDTAAAAPVVEAETTEAAEQPRTAPAAPEQAAATGEQPPQRVPAMAGMSQHEVDAPPPAEPPRPPSLFSSPFHHEPQAAEPVVFEPAAVVAAPLFLPPDAAKAEELRRPRRAERETKPEEKVEKQAVEPVAEDSDADSDWDDDQEHGSDERGEEGARSRRRRRGRRGRGRGRGEQHSEHDNDDDSDDTESEQPSTGESADAASESETADAEDSEDGDTPVPEGSSRRRRRRRRRKAGEDSENEPADDDPPNTVVHEREPRNKRRAVDEVQGISGSTRLEAKRQRRRDGREAGRRRPPILTESEFLARRESVDRVMVVREKTFPEHPSATIQVAVLEDNILVEHFVTSTGQASMVGNVYLGKVQNVLPSMEAAFVDIGRGRNGVLYAGEVNWEAAGLGGKERKIEQALKPGDTVLVQVSKDPVGHKGARLTTQISLAGRFLVYVPGGTSTGISRKLPDTERKRLKEILRDIVPQDAGVIIRTASEGVSETELARDVERLQATWKTIEEQSKNGSSAPKTLYEEPDLLVKVIRDLFNEDFSKLVIEGERAWTTVENYIRTVAPDLLARIERYESNGVDVFGSFRIDEQLAKALDRKVWLPSGGTLVIDRTEAMTVIDVNTGKFTGAGGSNLEETVTRNNLEAAEEIVRQLRLRDIGGMIVVDFIDMVLESNRDLVLRRLTEALGRDRTRHQVSEVTSLGLVQMTRKKLGTGLVEAFSTTCEHCHGRGIVVHNYPVETAPAEEGVGRREGRRRRKEKAPAATVAPAPQQPQPEHSEEDAAVKRAHPVALAMAAHQAEEAAAVAVAQSEVAAAAAEAVAAAVADEVEVESAETGRSGGRGGRAGRAARRAMRREARAESAAVAEAGAEPAGTDDDRAEQTAGEEGRSERIASAEQQERDPGDVRSEITASDRSERAAEEPAADADRVASGEERAARSGSRPGEGDRFDRAAAVADARAESPADDSQDGQPAADSGRRGRRRVARTTAAPSTDSKGAVFVLSSADQEQGPSFTLDDIAPTEVAPRSRPRRRAAGRAAGAPQHSD